MCYTAIGKCTVKLWIPWGCITENSNTALKIFYRGTRKKNIPSAKQIEAYALYKSLVANLFKYIFMQDKECCLNNRQHKAICNIDLIDIHKHSNGGGKKD